MVTRPERVVPKPEPTPEPIIKKEAYYDIEEPRESSAQTSGAKAKGNRKLQDIYGKGKMREFKFTQKESDSSAPNITPKRDSVRSILNRETTFTKPPRSVEEPIFETTPQLGKPRRDWVMIISIIVIILGLAAIAYLYYVQNTFTL